jgi:predicted transcriptional regulator
MGIMQTLLTLLVAGHDMTPSHAAALFDRSRQNAQKALARLAKRGLARAVRGAYMATPEGMEFIAAGCEVKSGPTGPSGKPRVVENTLRCKAWRAMRIKGKFGLDDLARACLDGSESDRDPVHNINRYVSALAATGYLVEMKRRAPGTALTSPGKKRWMLTRDTGPKAPIRRTNGDVFDPNENRVYPKGERHE